MPPAPQYRQVDVELTLEGLKRPAKVGADQILRNATALAIMLGVDREIERGHLAELTIEALKLAFYMGQLASLEGALYIQEMGALNRESIVGSAEVAQSWAESCRLSLLNKTELVAQCPESPAEVN